MTGLSLYSRLLRYVRPYRWAFGLAVFGMVIVAAGDLMLAWLVIPIVRNFEAPDPTAVLWLPFTLVGVFLLRGVGAYISEFGMDGRATAWCSTCAATSSTSCSSSPRRTTTRTPPG